MLAPSGVPRGTRLGAPRSGAWGLCAPGAPRLGCEGQADCGRPSSLSLLSSPTVLCGSPLPGDDVQAASGAEAPAEGRGWGAALDSLSSAPAPVGSPAPRPWGGRPGSPWGGPGDS